jgi:hypothetical protein
MPAEAEMTPGRAAFECDQDRIEPAPWDGQYPFYKQRWKRIAQAAIAAAPGVETAIGEPPISIPQGVGPFTPITVRNYTIPRTPDAGGVTREVINEIAQALAESRTYGGYDKETRSRLATMGLNTAKRDVEFVIARLHGKGGEK